MIGLAALGSKQKLACFAGAALLVAALMASMAAPLRATAQSPASGAATPSSVNAPTAPLLAYYYIWFDVQSWDRAKTDYPVLGRYSSDDREVMRQHVRWAKDAGIKGFIVSWKNTEKLSKRLETLVEICRDEDFKLAIIYQGLNFDRDPLDIMQIAGDLDYFIEEYGRDPVFDIFGRPMVIWSGTWEFSPEQIEQVATPRRDALLILASEKNAEDYLAKAHLVDGNAYYWSSVNPHTYPSYPEKLQDMARAVHDNGGLWIAPAAPGFDARLVGGERIVEREQGEMLRLQLQVAAAASPDAIGLISWNEFSENSQIEPSCTYGTEALQVVADVEGGSLSTGIPAHCAEATPTTSPTPDTGPTEVAQIPVVATTVTPDATEMTPTPWPTSKIASGFVDPVRPTTDSDFDSSAPAATDRSIGRMARIGMLGALAIFLVALTLVRTRATRSM